MAKKRSGTDYGDGFVDAPFIIGDDNDRLPHAMPDVADGGIVMGDGVKDFSEDSASRKRRAKKDKKAPVEKTSAAAETVGGFTVSAEGDAAADVEKKKTVKSSKKNSGEKKAEGRANRKLIIALSCAAAAAAVLCAAFFTLSHFWRNGMLVMPSFVANTGLYQGDNFKFFDGISVNGIDIGGLTLEKAKAKLKAAANKNSKKYDITVTYEDKRVSFTEDDIEYTLDDGAALKSAKAFCIAVMRGEAKKTEKDYTAAVLISEKCKKKIAEKAGKAINKEAVDASIKGVEGQGLVFSDEQPGITLDEDELITALQKNFSEGKHTFTLAAQVKKTEPKITKASLTEHIKLLSEHSTRSYNNANGNSNMRKAMNMCNGSVIEPGATWSFNGHTGNSESTANGWKPATGYAGGYLVQTVGGGICQASTTIYIAALYANMGVVERKAHAWKAEYASAGFDATVDYGRIDLKLKNRTSYPMYFSCYMSGTTLTCKIYGSRENSFDGISCSATEIARVSGDYFKVRSYRTVTLNGKSVTETLPDSVYSLKPQQTQSEATASSTPSPSQPSSGGNTSGGTSGGGTSGGESGGGTSGGNTSGGTSGGQTGGETGGESGGESGGNTSGGTSGGGTSGGETGGETTGSEQGGTSTENP